MAGVILYGAPAPGLVEVPAGRQQVSPLIPGSADLAAMAEGARGRGRDPAPPAGRWSGISSWPRRCGW